MARNVLTVTQAAAELNVSRMTVLRLVKAGQLHSFRTTTAATAHIRIYADSIDEYKKLQERQPASVRLPPPTAMTAGPARGVLAPLADIIHGSRSNV